MQKVYMLQKSHFFSRLYFSFVLLVCLSIVLSLALSQYVASILNSEIRAVNYASLKQATEVFDEKLTSIFSIFPQLSKNEEINIAIRQDKKNHVLQLQNVLGVREYLANTYNTFIEDLFVYFPESNHIVSRTYTCFPVNRYADCYYSADKDLLLTNLANTDKTHVVSLPHQQSVLILQPLPVLPTRTRSAIACAVLDHVELRALFSSYSPRNGAIMLVDANGHLIASSNSTIIPSDVSIYLSESNYNTVSINGQDYALQTVTSTYMDYHLMSIAPLNVFWARRKTLSYISVTAYSSFTLLSLALSWYLCKRNYAPLSDLVSELHQIKSPIDTTEQKNEIAYIRSVINGNFQEQENMQLMRQQTLLRNALTIHTSDSCNTIKIFQDVGIRLLSENFVVILFQFEQSHEDSIESELTLPVIQKFIENFFPSETQIFVIMESDNLYAAIFNTALPSDNTLSNVLPRIIHFFDTSIHLQLTIAYGSEQRGICGIQHSYNEAQKALDYRAIYGPGALLPYTVIEYDNFSYLFMNKDETESLLLSCIRNGNPTIQEVNQHLHSHCNCDKFHLPEEFRCYYYDVCSLLKKVSSTLDLSPSILDALKTCDNLPAFDSSLVDTLHRMHEMMEILTHSTEQSAHIINTQVRLFIEQHYGDPSLSTNSVGNHFNMSGPYLSRLFADEQKRSIAAYISVVRIENAKRLLKETDLQVDTISEQCGFLSSSTFIRLFKKLEGITPGTYRKANQLNQSTVNKEKNW